MKTNYEFARDLAEKVAEWVGYVCGALFFIYLIGESVYSLEMKAQRTLGNIMAVGFILTVFPFSLALAFSTLTKFVSRYTLTLIFWPLSPLLISWAERRQKKEEAEALASE